MKTFDSKFFPTVIFRWNDSVNPDVILRVFFFFHFFLNTPPTKVVHWEL